MEGWPKKGQNVKTQSVDDDGDVFVLTCYDNMGRVAKTSNPFRNWSSQDCSTQNGTNDIFWTTNTFDTAGRPWKVTTPDTAHVDTTYSVATGGGQIGTVVTVTDRSEETGFTPAIPSRITDISGTKTTRQTLLIIA